MSDKRRRRRKVSGDSNESEEDEASITASDHEYESAAEEDSALEESDAEPSTENPDLVKKDPVIDLSDTNELLEEERGAGDGQEQEKSKVDDDEDRRNPQYIPKKGLFYEHDSRLDSGDEIEDPEGVENPEENPKRVPRSEKIERWGHDKFLEREQAPKTREELVSTYGYDIRNEDSAPRARRRRRYGRGPNKYTRDWKDEKAYDGPEKTEKPAKNTETKPRRQPEAKKNGKEQVKIDDKDQFPDLKSKKAVESKPAKVESKPVAAKEQNRNQNRGINSGRGGKSSANSRLQKEPRPIEKSEKHNKKAEKAVEAKLDKLEINEKDSSPKAGRKSGTDNEHTAKRYSNSRQGGQARSNNQDQRNNGRPHQDFKNYNDINGTVASTSHGSTNYANANFPTNASGPPPAAPFLPAGVPGPAPAGTPTSTSGFLDPSAMVNYGPPPPVQFTPVVPVTVTLPLGASVAQPIVPQVTAAPDQVLLAAVNNQGYAEVRGGVTYFNPSAQMVHNPQMARPMMSKRPKAAIPIVDPSTQISPEDQNGAQEINHENFSVKT